MVPYEEALATVLSESTRVSLTPTNLPINSSLSHILSEDVIASSPMPPFRASIMDGYAVCSSDGPGEYTLIGEAMAGHETCCTLTPGTVAYVTTGGAVPEGADAVIKVEWTRQGSGNTVHVLESVAPGQWVRQIGSDIPVGATVLRAGSKIGATEIGLLATLGIDQVKVLPKPRIGVLSTGDELDAEQELSSNKIRDSNRPMLLALISELGAIGVDLGVVKDSPEAVERALEADVDILVSTGGVSMGKADWVKPMLQRKAKVHFGRVCLKPGKPTTFATYGNKLVFALPGNPVSAYVTFMLFAYPSIQVLLGEKHPGMDRVFVKTTQEIRMDPERPEFHRAVVYYDLDTKTYFGTSTGNQLSSRLLSVYGANALMEIPQGSGVVSKGTLIPAMIIGRIGNHKPESSLGSSKPVSNGCGHSHGKGHSHKHKKSVKLSLGLLVCSDRASKGEYEDKCIPSCIKALDSLGGEYQLCKSLIVSDDMDVISSTLVEWSEPDSGIHVIFTLGGTGFGVRDVTPEATRSILDREAPGLSTAILLEGMKHVDTAMLSRGVAGTRNSTIIINLVGSPKGVAESLTAIWHALPHASSLLTNAH